MKALAIGAGIVFWTLVLGVAVLVFFPGGNAGEPVAVLQIDTAPPAAPPKPPATTDNVQLPPGFGVTGPVTAPAPPTLAPPGTTMMPPPQIPGPGGSLEQPERHGEAEGVQPGGEKIATADLTAGIDATGSVPLAEVPVPALVEESEYGPLPKIAADGRRPAEVYARPSLYGQVAGGPPRVAVLVSGLGVPGGPDGDVIKGLPPPVSIAYGAYGRSLQERVTKARDDGHEVLLAIPLEPKDYPAEDPGPHVLLTTLPTDENVKRLQWLMSRYTGYVGVTNDMGAKFEVTEASLRPMLEEVKRRGLLYLDDGSVEGSVAGQVAKGLGLDYSVAQVQLDAHQMAKALAALEAAAKAQGAAIGVAKAEPDTVKKITEWAGSLEAKGLVLVPVSAAMRSQRQS
jgi:polysaccharide deacetylase 2 family uncharacterized protein YibQ